MTELVNTYKETPGGWGWVVEEETGGGGGGLPDWWTIDSTPNQESVNFNGQVVVTPNVVEGAVVVDAPAGFVDTLNDGVMFGARMQGGSGNWADDYVYKLGVLDMVFKSPPGEGDAHLRLMASDHPGQYAHLNTAEFKMLVDSAPWLTIGQSGYLFEAIADQPTPPFLIRQDGVAWFKIDPDPNGLGGIYFRPPQAFQDGDGYLMGLDNADSTQLLHVIYSGGQVAIQGLRDDPNMGRPYLRIIAPFDVDEVLPDLIALERTHEDGVTTDKVLSWRSQFGLVVTGAQGSGDQLFGAKSEGTGGRYRMQVDTEGATDFFVDANRAWRVNGGAPTHNYFTAISMVAGTDPDAPQNKLGFFGATAVVQPAADLSDREVLEALGLVAAGGGMFGVPVANPTDVVLDSTTYDDPIAGGGAKLTTLVFPGDQGAIAFATLGDDFPRLIIPSDPTDAVMYMGDGTFDPTNGPHLILTGGGAMRWFGGQAGGTFSLGVDPGPNRFVGGGRVETGLDFGPGSPRIDGGTSAPNVGGELGDLYFRADPSGANETIYRCTVAGAPGAATWVGIL